MPETVFIKEIFESIQGEGPYAGINQLFIRFTRCNLNCHYCDTDFKSDILEYSLNQLLTEVNKYKNIHSVSLTGGEPLLESDFLEKFLPELNNKVYLETNGTLYKNFEKIVKNIDIVSMDIKLPSSSKSQNLFLEHEKFVDIAIKYEKELFLKIVFDENITDEEIEKSIKLAKKGDFLIVLQPKTDKEKITLSSQLMKSVFYKFNNIYRQVRLIPQIHKFLNVE